MSSGLVLAVALLAVCGALTSPRCGGEAAAQEGPGLVEGLVEYRGHRFRVVDSVAEEPSAPSGVIRYRVLVEAGLEAEAGEFTAAVEGVLGSDAGWARAGRPLVRVSSGEDISVLLARPKTIDALCAPMRTGGALSCAVQRQANINVERFRRGAQTWGDDVVGYRSYVINHEVGHLLGMRHAECPRPGDPAPVMMQQTIRVGRCRPSGQPTEAEIDAVRGLERARDARWARLKEQEARWRRRQGAAPASDPR